MLDQPQIPQSLSRLVLVGICLATACASKPQLMMRRAPMPKNIDDHCSQMIGQARVEQITDDIFVAIGYDLANTILIRTDAGNIIVDPMMTRQRAERAKADLLAKAPGKTAAIIYTHSHIDHIGGAAVWAEENTEIWATDRFTEHLLKQYGAFREVESIRGMRQFGRHLPDDALVCSALGLRVDFDGAQHPGIKLPTRTFSGVTEVTVGGTTLQLHEAHGETDDQLFVWLPDAQALLPGDNYYAAFPNLYTIRGTRPRPMGAWIESLDAMRALQPKLLLPSHTVPLRGNELIEQQLRDYRDAIAWVRNTTILRANQGERFDSIVDNFALPQHLHQQRALLELYGQVDWSVRAVLTNELGWFDGDAEDLYPIPQIELLQHEIDAMGGAASVAKRAEAALETDPRWSLHLLAKLRHSGIGTDEDKAYYDAMFADVLERVAAPQINTNGRSYLLQRALELRGLDTTLDNPKLDDDFVASIPIENFFAIMTTRLRGGETLDEHRSVRFDFSDINRSVTLTVRRGIAEVKWGEPLPGTPEPFAVAKTDTLTWKKLGLKQISAIGAVASGALDIDGSDLDFANFMDLFEQG